MSSGIVFSLLQILVMNQIGRVFLIDDDSIHLQVTRRMIEQQRVAEHIVCYMEADLAFAFIMNHLSLPALLPDVILLDLNMPVMNGWEFLDAMQHFKDRWPKPVRIYVLTSSLNESDLHLVKSYDMVTGYLAKPLTKEAILSLGGDNK